MREALALALAAVVGVAPASVPEGACEVQDVSITWGFKESFRSYISGSIAQGSWEVSGDVGYEIPHFTLTGGTGHVDAARDEGIVAFEGGIVFSGHDGILETSLQNPELIITGSREATLMFDVTGDTMEEVSVNQPDVPFATVTWGRGAENVVPSDRCVECGGCSGGPHARGLGCLWHLSGWGEDGSAVFSIRGRSRLPR
jgi:hypothetical protein